MSFLWSDTIEVAVLLVIIYDVVWHRWNAKQEIKRDEEGEARTIQREKEAERRQIRRERETIVRKHWQQLQSALLLLQLNANMFKQHREFIRTRGDSTDPTVRHALLMVTNRLPEVLADFDSSWAEAVALLNVFPLPRDPLVSEVIQPVLELGKTAKDKETEVKDETLLALAQLITRVADMGTLPNPEAD